MNRKKMLLESAILLLKEIENEVRNHIHSEKWDGGHNNVQFIEDSVGELEMLVEDIKLLYKK